MGVTAWVPALGLGLGLLPVPWLRPQPASKNCRASSRLATLPQIPCHFFINFAPFCQKRRSNQRRLLRRFCFTNFLLVFHTLARPDTKRMPMAMAVASRAAPIKVCIPML